jgi:hypothetical protein
MNERDLRIARLTSAPRLMSKKAAATVVDGAMSGIGCIEGQVRERIEQERIRDQQRKS